MSSEKIVSALEKICIQLKRPGIDSAKQCVAITNFIAIFKDDNHPILKNHPILRIKTTNAWCAWMRRESFFSRLAVTNASAKHATPSF